MRNPKDQGNSCVLLEPGLVEVLLFALHAELHVPAAWPKPPAHDILHQVTGKALSLHA